METYKWANKTYHAWSEMQCKDARKLHTEHLPHTWGSKYMLYGPYMCWGHPNHKYKLPTEDELKVLVGEQMERLRWLRDYLPNASKEAKALDKIKRWLGDHANKADT